MKVEKTIELYSQFLHLLDTLPGAYLSLNEIQAELSEPIDRRTIYLFIHQAEKDGYSLPMVYQGQVRKYFIQPKQVFSLPEVQILSDSIANNTILTAEHTKDLQERVASFLSLDQRKLLSPIPVTAGAVGEEELSISLEMILRSIAAHQQVSFRYFNVYPGKVHRYRRDGQRYLVLPKAVYLWEGHYYVIVYGEKYDNFSTYRLDRMDGLKRESTTEKDKPLDVKKYLRESIDMYHNSSQTIEIEFAVDDYYLVYDKFPGMILTARTDRCRASIPTSISPTLIGWLMQYPDKIKVNKPDVLVKELYNLGRDLVDHYAEGNPNE